MNLRTKRLLQEVLGFGAIAISFILVAAKWAALPASVPIHFGLNGRPDAWASKEVVFLLPGVGFFLWLMLATLRRFPKHFNYPVTVTTENRGHQERLAVHLLDWIRLEISFLFCFITWEQVRVALKETEAINVWLLFLFIAAILGTVLNYVRSARRIV